MRFKFAFVSKDSEFKMPREKMDNLDRVHTMYFQDNS